MAKVETPVIDCGVRIRRATVDDLPALVRIHKMAYSPSHFTALLPDEVLKRYYGYFLDGESEICLALGNADDRECRSQTAEEVQGFAVYGLRIPERIAMFKRNCFKDILLTSIRHPWIAARKMLSAAFGRLKVGRAYPPAEFLLLSIAVAVPRRGIGTHLMNSMLDVARQRRCQAVGLYVNADNVNAINAYFAAGFVIMDFQRGQFYMERNFDQA